MSRQLMIDDLVIDMDIALLRRLNLKVVVDNAIKLGIARNKAELYRNHDLDPSYMSQLLNGHRNMAETSARNIEKQLGLQHGDLDKSDLDFSPDLNQISEKSHKNLEIAQKIGYQLNRWVPVKAYSRMGVDGFYTDMGYGGDGGDGYVPSLTAGPAAYAVKGTGGSMHPAIRDGWYAVCDPEADLVPTEYVEIELSDGRRTIKEFIAKTGSLLVVQSVSTGERYTFDISEVKSIAAVIDIVPPSRHMPQIPVMTIKNTN